MAFSPLATPQPPKDYPTRRPDHVPAYFSSSRGSPFDAKDSKFLECVKGPLIWPLVVPAASSLLASHCVLPKCSKLLGHVVTLYLHIFALADSA